MSLILALTRSILIHTSAILIVVAIVVVAFFQYYLAALAFRLLLPLKKR